MKIYGRGTLKAPGTSRAIWDFAADGIFESVNPAVLAEAKRRGCWLGDEAVARFEADHAAPVVQEPKKRGRPRKEVADERS